jgi:flagellar biosynthesis/type III secretory pathway M-ring protein FliF/YscJ
MEGLKDIKGFIEVPDQSFLYFMLTIAGVLLFIIGLVILVIWYKKPKRRRKRLTAKEQAIINLKAIDFLDTKEAVYDFSENVQKIVHEHEGVQALLEKLETYKYKKDVPSLSDEDKESMKALIKELTNE